MRPAGARQLRADDDAQPRRRRELRLVDESLPGTVPDAAESRVRELRPAEDQGSRRSTGARAAARPGRRTVQITGQAGPPRRRPSPTASRVASRPDRVALWALMLGLFLVLMAVVTTNAGA